MLLNALQAIDPSRFNDYLLLAYGVMWLVVIVYIANLANKQRNLQQDIQLMRRLLEEDEGESEK
jgi:CcmD family protein